MYIFDYHNYHSRPRHEVTTRNAGVRGLRNYKERPKGRNELRLSSRPSPHHQHSGCIGLNNGPNTFRSDVQCDDARLIIDNLQAKLLPGCDSRSPEQATSPESMKTARFGSEFVSRPEIGGFLPKIDASQKISTVLAIINLGQGLDAAGCS